MNPQAPGLFLADKGFVVPPATGDTELYLQVVRDLCNSGPGAPDVAIPLVDEELHLWREHWDDELIGIPSVLTPTTEFIRTCLDKWELMRTLARNEVKRPYTCFFTGMELPLILFPAVIKPRRGRGSRDVHQINCYGELLQTIADGKLRFSADFIAQEYIDGPEYTVSVIVDQHNRVHAVVPKEIIRKEGQTWLAVTRKNDRIDALCRRIAEVMQPHGPFNVQLRLRDGEPYVFEINPRFSGTVNLTIAAGCDEVGGLIELALGNPYTFGEWKEGVVLVRHMEDSIMEETEFQGKAPVRWDE